MSVKCELSYTEWVKQGGEKTDNELKTCPFCGGVAFVQKDGDQYFIKCLHKDNCYLAGRKAQKYNVPEAMIKK